MYGGRGYMRNLLFSIQYCCDLKTAIKDKVYLKIEHTETYKKGSYRKNRNSTRHTKKFKKKSKEKVLETVLKHTIKCFCWKNFAV